MMHEKLTIIGANYRTIVNWKQSLQLKPVIVRSHEIRITILQEQINIMIQLHVHNIMYIVYMHRDIF